MDGLTDSHSGCNVANVGLEQEGQSCPLKAKRWAGDEQQEGLHRLHDGAGVQDVHFSTAAGKRQHIIPVTVPAAHQYTVLFFF